LASSSVHVCIPYRDPAKHLLGPTRLHILSRQRQESKDQISRTHIRLVKDMDTSHLANLTCSRELI
jgi:hypothetical protein